MTTSQVKKVTVTENEHGQRIDNFIIKHLSGVPRSHVYRLLRSGQVRVNGGRVKPSRKLQTGEEVRLPPVRLPDKSEAVRPPDGFLELLRQSIFWEDEHYLVLNKPSGPAVHAGSGSPYGVIEGLKVIYPDHMMELCHRLDRETSGTLLLAKSRPALLRAHEAFKSGGAEKKYLALLCGELSGSKKVQSHLAKNKMIAGERRVMQSTDEGKLALSDFEIIQRYRQATLCEVHIATGRMHQIRVHAADLGHPLAGDRKYGMNDKNAWFKQKGLRRVFLHARKLTFERTAEFPRLTADIPLPDELKSVTDNLSLL